MNYTVYFSDSGITTKAGFGKVAHLPCIFDSRPGYHRLGSRYLIDRGLGVWTPKNRGMAVEAVAPSDQTILNYAHWLANFLEWAELRGIDLFTCTYAEHVQGRYQTEMLDGIWSRDAVGLKPSTINLRVQQACDFLTWMSDKGLRSPFHIATETVRVKSRSATSSVGHRSKEIEVRKGKVRQNKRRLRMPTDAQLDAWLGRVYGKAGDTKGLMCETILLTAMRREEVACWRVDTLPPEKKDWHINNPAAPRNQQQVQISIKFGTKGPGYGYDHGDKIGPVRSIWIPLELAERLDEYRRKHRNSALRKWVKSVPASEQRRRINEVVHLFLDEQTGARITSKHLYQAWTSAELPFEGWSPHLGRDWWACSVLWRELKKHEHLLSLGVETATALLESTAMSIIRLQIQPQLGHAHDSTTMIYLQWVTDMLSVGLSVRYEAEHDNKFHLEINGERIADSELQERQPQGKGTTG
ncbi:site-specific integrase [Burkholderia cepacia]|uniref:site-specific integrase n=1 Tax=Burkholderia cepacia TaxID=292 RepID=UPI000F5E587D|nr:site-specific integrase [Burkholderia cepacia]RQZ76985.1 site-specific integrase [Burkholderia cepacia]